MSNIYGAETQLLGGGFGGWGGGYGYGGGGFGSGFLGGILGGALFGGRGGLFGGRDGGHGGHCCCGCSPCQCAQHTEAVILDDAHYNSLQAAIGGVKDNITSLGYNIGDKFGATNAAIANVNYNQAINTKDIIHDIDIQTCNLGSKIDKCCCETNHNVDNKFFALSKQMSDCCCELQKEGLKNTQVILDKMCQNEIQALRDRLCRCEKDNDMFRFSANFRAQTVGSNFNTGTQTQSTSNNSGQVVGA